MKILVIAATAAAAIASIVATSASAQGYGHTAGVRYMDIPITCGADPRCDETRGRGRGPQRAHFGQRHFGGQMQGQQFQSQQGSTMSRRSMMTRRAVMTGRREIRQGGHQMRVRPSQIPAVTARPPVADPAVLQKGAYESLGPINAPQGVGYHFAVTAKATDSPAPDCQVVGTSQSPDGMWTYVRRICPRH